MPKSKEPRINVRVSRGVHVALHKHIPHGMRGPLIDRTLAMILAAVEVDGQQVAGAIIDGKFKIVRSG